MSTYIYTFINGDKIIEATGYNIWNAAKNGSITISRVDKLGSHYLQQTPFNYRERYVWVVGEYGSSHLYTVKQRYNK